MRYIKLENNIPVHYSIEQLFQDCPNAIIYKIIQTQRIGSSRQTSSGVRTGNGQVTITLL